MKLTFLGTGSAFTLGDGNFQSNMLLESKNGKRLLIDCGTDARFSLYELGFTYKDIDDVYISHLHTDHVGGLEWLGFSNYFDPHPKRLGLYTSDALKGPLWDHVLSGGLASLQGVYPPILSTFFDVRPLLSGNSFEWEGAHFKLVQTIHVYSGFTLLPSFGLFITFGDEKIFITTDTQFAPHQILDFYESATLILQDCETSKYATGIHARFSELITLPLEIRKKMWLYHYNPGPLPQTEEQGFCGFIKKGQSFNF